MDVGASNPTPMPEVHPASLLDDPLAVAHALNTPGPHINGTCPVNNVVTVWPLIISGLKEFGIDTPLTRVAAAATARTETGIFYPIKEKRANQTKQHDLWLLQERYYPSGFYGRGLVQTTWRENYWATGVALKLDLIANPDLLLVPEHAARALAWFFKIKGVGAAAEAQNWRLTRSKVNGGYTAWDEYNAYLLNLLELISA
jgi:predicted chitinase